MDSVHHKSDSATTPSTGTSNSIGHDAKDEVCQPSNTPKLTKSQKQRRRRWAKRRAQAQTQPTNAPNTEHVEHSSSTVPSPSASSSRPETEAVDDDAQDVKEHHLSKSQKRRRRRAMKLYGDKYEPRAASSSIEPDGSSSSTTISNLCNSQQPFDEPTETPVPRVKEGRSQAKHSRQAKPQPTQSRSKPVRQSLATLPVEIQLKILEACLVTSSHYIQLTIRDRHGRIFPQPEAHKDVAFDILRACRLYWEEGSKIFWGKNQFLLCLSTLGPASTCVLDGCASALRWIKRLTLNYKILECH